MMEDRNFEFKQQMDQTNNENAFHRVVHNKRHF